jgi:hypothetical protein
METSVRKEFEGARSAVETPALSAVDELNAAAKQISSDMPAKPIA